MKHGPLALVDDKMPILVIATNDSMVNKMSSVIAQLHARGAQLIVLCNECEAMKSLNKQRCTLIEVRAFATPGTTLYFATSNGQPYFI
jgi:glucosamine 6-phosphate synthetase-like amidotransferase/phosphosugar isomerase protein